MRMSNGYLLAAAGDVPAAHEIGEGFGLDVIDASAVGDHGALAATLVDAPNVGILLSTAATNDSAFVALLQALASRLGRAQLITVEAGARGAFAFLPAQWPAMSLDEARTRANALARQRGGDTGEQPHAQPLPPAAETAPEPAPQDAQPEAPAADESDAAPPVEADGDAPAPGAGEAEERAEDALEGAPEEPPSDQRLDQDLGASDDAPASESFGGGAPELEIERKSAEEVEPPAPPPAAEPSEPVAAAPAPPAQAAPPPRAEPPSPPAKVEAPASTQSRARAIDVASAPADATAFAPKKLRRNEAELVRIVVHQPKDLNDVIKAARKIDPRTEPAPSGVSIGEVAIGASVGVALEVRGATTDGTVQRRTWTGEPIDFSFAVEADASVKQVVLLARVFVNDAQIGVLAFTRNVSGPAKKPHSAGDRVRLKRHKRVFLSYSSKDRETVSQIATAYQMAGVEHFWDRASLKSGEEWHPRLRREIDRADLFHLCWSKAAAESEWVQKEAEHALTRRKKNSGKPDITVQMLDGPPWAKHPAELDAINFDDFVRAAIVGYARGDGS
jgi:hypothetical protein